MTRLLMAAMAAGAMLAGPWAGAAAAGETFGAETFTLDNGMQVVVIANHRAPVVHHSVWYKTGAADEPAGVVVNARAPDGVIEGIEAPAHGFCLGVQWHPEFEISAGDGRLFAAFVEAARGTP